MKKLISILLVGVILTCIFVLPASATEIEPYAVVIECPECGGLLRFESNTITNTGELYVPSCEKYDFFHPHLLITTTRYANCSECGGRFPFPQTQEVCP